MQSRFKYAELKEYEGRLVAYFRVYDPVKQQTVPRFRRIPVYEDKALTRRHAKRIVNQINKDLDEGWNPLIEGDSTKRYTPIAVALEFALKQKLRTVRAQGSAPDYRSKMKKLEAWLREKQYHAKPLINFTSDWAQSYLHWLLAEHVVEKKPMKALSNTSHNNHLSFCNGVFNVLVKFGYVNEKNNPFAAIDKLPEDEPDKRTFTDSELQAYADHLRMNNKGFLVVSGLCYFMGFRPAEMGKLKVRQIDQVRGMIKIMGSQAKNHKSMPSFIPDAFYDLLMEHIAGAGPDDYIISRNKKGKVQTFKPGPEKVAKNAIGRYFQRYKIESKIGKDLTFYDLKDTAAERLERDGFTVRDIQRLFRHTLISTTDKYMLTEFGQKNERMVKEFPGLG